MNNSQQRFFAVMNAGSSSLKFSLFAETADNRLERWTDGGIEGVGSRSPSFTAFDNNKNIIGQQKWNGETTAETLLRFLIDWIENYLKPNTLNAVGHRMLHGGTLYDDPVLITPHVLEKLRALTPLAPLHQPRILRVIESIAERYPSLHQVVCFDTSFHQTNTYLSRLYGLPQSLTNKGYIRYGFHGLSFEYVSQELFTLDVNDALGKTIIAHLGSGASLCALDGGKSVATTMGFSALDGLVMGSRCGQIDPGLILYLLQHENYTPEQLEKVLYQESGLLGVSGISSNMRDLLSSQQPNAQLAIDLFVYRVVREIGSLVAALGGLNTLVFTAGIGERSAAIRTRICQQLSWLGLKLDNDANRHGELKINSQNSAISVWIIPTYEELMIARHIAHLVP